MYLGISFLIGVPSNQEVLSDDQDSGHRHLYFIPLIFLLILRFMGTDRRLARFRCCSILWLMRGVADCGASFLHESVIFPNWSDLTKSDCHESWAE